MTTTVNAYAAAGAGTPFEPFHFELPELGVEDVDIRVDYCGVCHSDLSMCRTPGAWRALRRCPATRWSGR